MSTEAFATYTEFFTHAGTLWVNVWMHVEREERETDAASLHAKQTTCASI